MKIWRACLSPNITSIFTKTIHKKSGFRSFQAQCIRKTSRFATGPGLKDFVKVESSAKTDFSVPIIPYLKNIQFSGNSRKVKFEVYGCQMNVNDTEIIWSILKDVGYEKTENICEADVLLMVTCAIREGAESKIWRRLNVLKNRKLADIYKRQMKVGILGCMAERLKHKILDIDKSVDVIAGPDSYRDLPRLLSVTENNQTAVNVLLSLEETYADVLPVRLNKDSVSAFVSIMRGCDNMCSYCIVPFTRGKERSRPISSILDEIRYLSDCGVKEVTLLGQNVNSYRDNSAVNYCLSNNETNLVPGFKTVYKNKKGGFRFDKLLDDVSRINLEMRIRFTSPHPKDFPNEVLELIKERPNICSSLHVPAQSGSTDVLERMRRGYTREAYLSLIENIRNIIPDVTLSSDFICGFCGETEEDFQQTISLMKLVQFNTAYLFAYSMREKTTAHRRFVDDVPQNVKLRRVTEIVQVFRDIALRLNQSQIGRRQLVLVEGVSKKENNVLMGRNDGNIRVLLSPGDIKVDECSDMVKPITAGDYIAVQITEANSQVLKGIPLHHSSISQFYSNRCESNQSRTLLKV